MTSDEVILALRKHSNLFLRAYIYGSTINNSQDDFSDVDILLVRETHLSFFDRLREVFDLFYEFDKVDLNIYTEEEFNSMCSDGSRYFIHNAVESGVRVEGCQKRSSQVADPG